MKNEKLNADKLENSKNETTNHHMSMEEDEKLNLDELLDIQGGIEDNQSSQNCGLGCFTGAMINHDQTRHTND